MRCRSTKSKGHDMKLRIRKQPIRDVYFELVRQHPLRPIRSDSDHDQAISMMDQVLKRGKLTTEEEDYLKVLSDLVLAYEDRTEPILPVPDDAMLRHLIESRAVTQAEVAKATGIAESTISAVLSGKRKLSRTHIGKLARYFHVSPDVFAFFER